MYLYFILYYWIIFHCMDISHFIYLFIHLGTSSPFWLLGIMLLQTLLNLFLWGHVFSFPLAYIQERTAGSHGNSIFNPFRTSILCFQSICIISISVSPHHCQHYFLASLMDAKWCFIMMLIFISLITNDIEHLFMSL